ncbi:MAG: NAD-dependent DNA ligase LigA [Spirochaeta sp.]
MSSTDDAPKKIRQEVDELIDSLSEYDRAYYQQGRSLVSDQEYDRLYDRLTALEQEYPDLKRADSPTQRVGSDLSADLPEAEHSAPVLSLDKVYNPEDLEAWQNRIRNRFPDQDADIICEEKMDGVSIVLYYEDGRLERAVTRGNGRVGNDVTPNIRTIRSIPLRLPEPLDIAVRGEVFLRRSDFEKLNTRMENPFANPRNLAAGTIRRVKSRGVAEVPLRFFGYDVDGLEEIESHHQALMRLYELGFPVNTRCAWIHSRGEGDAAAERFSEIFPESLVGGPEVLGKYIRQETDEREKLEYEIDGLVAKLDDISTREEMGYTGHHPRWAVALKFDSPQGISRVLEIDVQVGRTGRITPVARIEPVEIGGSTVQNVTLHNQEYIVGLELTTGDTVAVSKRGDVIPAVEQVLEKGDEQPPVWQLPKKCPACGSEIEVRGAHAFCPNIYGCPAQQRERLRFFVGRNQMDIDGLGPETLETLIRLDMVQDIPDLYETDYQKLMDEAGFGKKKIAQIEQGVEQSKQRPYRQVLPSLGVPEVGPKVTQLLCDNGINTIDDLLEIADSGDAERLSAIHGIGPRTAGIIIEQFSQSRLQKVIDRLRKHGLRFADDQPESGDKPEQIFAGQTWVVTGSFEHFQPRTKAEDEIQRRGGKVTGSVSGNTDYLLAGSGAGSKYDKAVSQGVEIIDESKFLKMLNR